MSNLVIVALPEEDDYVNKISSEKVAHMTICFLGEVGKVKHVNEILNFTEHAASQTLMRFGLEVDHRGVLGPDQADTLIFSKSKWSGFDTINEFRSNLLKYDNIRTAYDSTEQYPEWIPHLTLGYPATPANPDERDYPGIKYVSFDRIAVWFMDYDGVEFPLKAFDWDMAMAMGNITSRNFVENSLAHDIRPYDPIKAHEYYIKNRQLKGRRKASSVISRPRAPASPTVSVKLGNRQVQLTQKQLREQQVYAAQRVSDIKKRLAELGDKLKKLMADANAKKNPTAADKAKAARQSKQYRARHKQVLSNKAKTARATRTRTKDPVAELKNTINQVKGRLTAAVETQRALAMAAKNAGSR